MDEFDIVIKILEKPSEDRTDEEIEQLAKSSLFLKWFANLKIEQKPDIQHALCEVMTLRYYNEDEFIFKLGDTGDYYCIILSGDVAVMAQLNKHLDDSEDKSSGLRVVDVLKTGQPFGEMALLYGHPRSASMLCKTPCWIGILSSQDYNSILGKVDLEQKHEKMQFLRQFSLFTKWSKQALSRFLLHFEVQHVKKGSIIYKKGDDSLFIYFIKTGSFNFSTTIQEDSEDPKLLLAQAYRLLTRQEVSRTKIKRNLNLRQKGPVQYFGDYEVLEDCQRMETCECTSLTAEIWVISKSDFQTRLRNNDTWDTVKHNHELEKQRRNDRVENLKSTEKIKDYLYTETGKSKESSNLFKLTKSALNRQIKQTKTRNLVVSAFTAPNTPTKKEGKLPIVNLSAPHSPTNNAIMKGFNNIIIQSAPTTPRKKGRKTPQVATAPVTPTKMERIDWPKNQPLKAQPSISMLRTDDPLENLFALFPKSTPNSPVERKKVPVKPRSNRVSAIIRFNKNMIGKSINKPSEPRERTYAKFRPTPQPHSQKVSKTLMCQKQRRARAYLKQYRLSTNVTDCWQAEWVSVQRSVSRSKDRKIAQSKHNCFRLQRTTDADDCKD